ncbi:nucleoside permease [Bremerella sp. JC817]|uniref:nucleoside permease n=1 Tax=Bremerella sp. JC817 TaxID=3231756 RepID=UPI003458E4AD
MVKKFISRYILSIVVEMIENPKLIGLSVMMFLQFFIWGAWYVTLGPYMAKHEMFDMISWAYTVGPIAAIISPFFLGFVADRFFASERVLFAMHLLGALAMFAAPFAAEQSATALVVIVFLHMLCYMPTLGLTNTLAFSNIDDQERLFPIIRVFGTIGWIAANVTVSSLLEADTTDMQFYVAGFAGLALALFSFVLPHTPPPSAGKAISFREIIGADTLALMKERSFSVFIIGSFLICIPLSAYYAYASTFVGKVGFEQKATVMSIGQGSEIVFMLLMPLFFSRLGVKWMLFAGMAAWVVRYGLFAGADVDNVQWMVVLGILLHGICYDFFFVTGFIYTDKKCGKELRGQAQGFLVFVTQGLGLGIGAQVMGAIAAAFTNEEGVSNWQMIWLMPCIMAGVVMILFGLLFNDKVDAADDETGYGTDEAPATEPSH